MTLDIAPHCSASATTRHPPRAHSAPPTTRMHVGTGAATRDMQEAAREYDHEDLQMDSATLVARATPMTCSREPVDGRAHLNAGLLVAIAGGADVSAWLAQGADVDARDAFGRTALAVAILHKNVMAGEALIAAGADVNAKDSQGDPVILRAGAPKCEKLLELMLGKQAQIDLTGYEQKTALMYAAANNWIGAVRILIQHRALLNERDASGATALCLAVQSGCLDAATLILAAGALKNIPTYDGATPAHWAANNNNARMILLLSRAAATLNATAAGWNDATPLICAASLGHDECVHALIYSGVKADETNSRGMRALHEAALRGHARTVLILLTYGNATINAFAGSDIEMTPVAFAVSAGKLDTLSVLINAGADVDLPDSRGETPLMMAIERANPDIVRELLVHGNADPSSTWAVTHQTPLIRAVLRNDLQTLKLLMNANARVHVKDIFGRTALNYASDFGLTDALAILGRRL